MKKTDMNLTQHERIDLYSKAFPKFEPLYLSKSGRIEGLWQMGANYRVKGAACGKARMLPGLTAPMKERNNKC